PRGTRRFTVGHSTRTLDEVVDLLKDHGILQVVDVAHYPRSRGTAQSNQDLLTRELPHRSLAHVWDEYRGVGRAALRPAYLATPPVSGFPAVLVGDGGRGDRNLPRPRLGLDGQQRKEGRDGHEGWKVCIEFQPSVVVADIQMPGLDGLQLCRRIRASKYSPDI